MNSNANCPNCGAPVTTEICPYCGVATGLETSTADMEYPVIECKEANINFWNTIFPLIFAVSFGLSSPMFFAPAFMPAITNDKEFGLGFTFPFIIGGIIFALIGLVALIIALRVILRYLLIKRNGNEISATVYGYMNDNIFINNSPAQIVKLLVQTNEGPRFILYQLGDIKKPYKINSTIKLKVYKNIFIIKKEDKNYF